MLLLGIIIGLVLGYIFKPQLEKILIKTVRYIKQKSAQTGSSGPEDQD
jgi:hypothetical protein